MRLIDADNLKNDGNLYIHEANGKDYYDIDHAPTIEAEPVRHGRWNVFFEGKELQCSACTATFWDEEQNGGTNYCPNCGAKMDGE